MTVASVMMMAGCGSESGTVKGKDTQVTIRVWHYYNGAQQDEFNRLVNEFNRTAGKEKGIVVESASQGTISDLETNVLASIKGKAGADEIPNIFAAYGDTAYEVEKLGYAVDLKQYFSEEELEKYIDGYIEEGCFSGDGTLKIFPVAKSVELLMLNKTDWDKFAAETGASETDLSTIEGVTKTAQKYYEWTDSQTEALNDGKAFFGRDAFANYMLAGYRQLSGDMFSREGDKVVLSFEKETVKKLWDNYYVPYIKGYFASSGRFRSDDIRVGNILACVSSSSSVTYFPDKVVLSDEESYPIEMETFACPKFADGQDYEIQQGAGMVVLKSSEEAQQASAEFLKWFTSDAQNISFSTASGYLPVTKSSNNIDTVMKTKEIDASVAQVLDTSFKMISENNMYTSIPFEKGTSARMVLETSMCDLAEKDRQLVKERLESGMSLSEASAEFDNDAYFEKWYEDTKAQLESFVG